MSIERRRNKQMPKNKVEKKVYLRELSSGVLDENNAFTLKVNIPGKGKLNIKVTFEKEEEKIKESI